MTIPDRFRSPHFAPLWRAVHERLSTGRRVTTVTVPVRTDDERLALAGLLDLPVRPSDTCAVRMAKLDAVCQEAAGLDARGVVTEVVGPVGDRAADRASVEAEREAVRASVREHPTVSTHPALASWAADVRFTHGSTEATRRLWHAAIHVLGALPAAGRPLPDFAHDTVRDTKALNDNTALSTLVLRALAALGNVPPPTTSGERHALWELHGVHSDQLSVTVLAAGLRPTGDDLVPTLLRTCADAGHAASLTLAQLRAAPPLDPATDEVWAVENPAVVALALDRFGASCPPLVCTSGWPNGAAMLLLRSIAEHAVIRYHGDLDGEGVRIAAHLAAATGVRPWRMTAADYRAAVHTHGPPVGRVTDAPWDVDLAPAMTDHGVAVPEEQVATALLDELAARSSGTERTGPETRLPPVR